MSEIAPEAPEAASTPTTADEPQTFDAAYVDKLRKEAAKYRTEAKANADAAARLAEYEESQKSEAQKASERIAALEAEIASTRAGALRDRIAAEHGIAPEDAALLLTGADEDTLKAQAERISARNADALHQGAFLPGQGTPAVKASGSTADQFAAFFTQNVG